MKEIFLRINQYLLFTVLLVLILYFGKTFLIPITFAGLLGMLMAPVCRRLDKLGLKRGLSTTICILILLAVLVGIGFVIASQFSAFADDVALIEKKGRELLSQIQTYLTEKVGVSEQKQEAVVKEQTKSAGKAAAGIAAKILGVLTSTVATIVISLVFTFLFIHGKEKYQNFFIRLYKDQDTDKVRKVTDRISEVGQQYLTGRVKSILIIAVLYSIGLSIIGLKNAVLLAGIAALLTVIPYVGTVLGGLFPVLMALVTEDTYHTALYAGLVMFVIQTMDNYFIEPNVVGGEVNVSALVSIASILAGGMIWGVAGMILFLPMAGITKIICDNVEPLKPFGYLLGEGEGKRRSPGILEWLRKKFQALKIWYSEKTGV
jgi:predicted PurR-regulated permease PerM